MVWFAGRKRRREEIDDIFNYIDMLDILEIKMLKGQDLIVHS